MKQILIAILCLLFAISMNAMNVADTTSKPQTEAVAPADSIDFIAAKDFDVFAAWLKKNLSYDDYLKLTPEQTLVWFYRWAVANWNEKKKKK